VIYKTGRSAYDPKVLLKVVLLGYSRGLMSSRKIEQKVQQLLNEQIEADYSKSNEPPDQAKRERQIQKLQKQADRIDKW